MPKATSSAAYSGQVKIKIKTRKGTRTIKKKNTGTDTLFKAIAKALAGYPMGTDIPTYISLAPATEKTWYDETTSPPTPLYTRKYPDYGNATQPISITGRAFGTDNNSDWFCRVTATIPQSNFSSFQEETNGFCAILLNGKSSNTTEENNALAYIHLEADGQSIAINQMQKGSSLVIEWDLYVRNYDEIRAQEQESEE